MLFSFLVMFGSTLVAQETKKIIGQVTDGKNPIENVAIAIVLLKKVLLPTMKEGMKLKLLLATNYNIPVLA